MMAADFWQAATMAGDFTHDGIVDTGDFVVWRKTVGSNDLRADANNDGMIDALDRDVWKANFGRTVALPSVKLTDGVLRIEGTDGDDVVTLRQHDGLLTIDGLDQYFTLASVSRIVVEARGGNDRVDLDPPLVPGLDAITRDAVLYGGAGADFVRGGAGNDVILGGTGNDELRGGTGNDHIDGEQGIDVAMGDDGFDVLLDPDSDDPLLSDNSDLVEGGLNAVYDGSSPIIQMLPYRNGVLTAFKNTGSGYRIHWSPNGTELGLNSQQTTVYDGSSEVIQMIEYQGRIYVAFKRGAGDYVIHRSDNIANLGSGEIVYEGASPVIQMLATNRGIYTAFSNTGRGYRIHWSSNGSNLGLDSPETTVYDGSSPVIQMIEFGGEIYTAFANAGSGYRIHKSDNGRRLGEGAPMYDGTSPVIQMLATSRGIYTAFANTGSGYRIHWSADGSNLGKDSSETTVYDGSSPVIQMIEYRSEIYTAFAGTGLGFRIHKSTLGKNLGLHSSETTVYDGTSPVLEMTVYRGEALTAFSNAGSNGYRIHSSVNGNHFGGSQGRRRVDSYFFDEAGRLYLITQNGDGSKLLERQSKTGREVLDNDMLKFTIRHGKAYTLGADGVLTCDGAALRNDVDNFFFDERGQLYVLGRNQISPGKGNQFERLVSSEWQQLDNDVLKFEILDNGDVYSLGYDANLNINGHVVCDGVEAFFFDPIRRLHCKFDTSRGGAVKCRLADGTWQELQRNVKQFAIGPDGASYALGDDGTLNIDGWIARDGVDAFFFDQAGLLYCKGQSGNGIFERRLADGTWQQLHKNVKQFAIRPDGSVYTLGEDGTLNIDGRTISVGIEDFFFDQAGQLYRRFGAIRNGLLDRRLLDGTLQELHTNIKQFAIRSDGTIYTLGEDGTLNVNGQMFSQNVASIQMAGDRIFLLLDDHTVWECDGQTRHLVAGTDARQFALLADGTPCTLSSDGILTIDGQAICRDASMIQSIGNRLYILRDDRAVWEYDGDGLRQITGNDVNMMLIAGGKLYVLPDNRAVWEYDGREFHQITGNDVSMMLVAGGKLYVLPDNRAVWEYDGREFHQITGNDVNMMLVAGGRLYVLPDNRAVWEYDGREFHRITGYDVNMMLVAGGCLYVLPDNRAVWKYDGHEFHQITANDVNAMLVAGGKLYVLPDNRAVWEYDGREFHRITGYDVNVMLVAGGKLYVLPDNRAVWEYDGTQFHRITGYDIKVMVPLGGVLHVLADNRAVWKYSANAWSRISGYDIKDGGIDPHGRFVLWTEKQDLFTLDSKGVWTLIDSHIEEFGYTSSGQLVWKRDGGFFDDIGDILGDIGNALKRYAPFLVGLLQSPIHGEALRAIIQHDQFRWNNVGNMFVEQAKIAGGLAASVATAGALAPAAGSSIAAWMGSYAAAGAAGAAASQSVLAIGDLSGLKNGFVFDPLAICKSAVIAGLSAGIKFVIVPSTQPVSGGMTDGGSVVQPPPALSPELQEKFYEIPDNETLLSSLQYDTRFIDYDKIATMFRDDPALFRAFVDKQLGNVKYDFLKGFAEYVVARVADPYTYFNFADQLALPPPYGVILTVFTEAYQLAEWGYGWAMQPVIPYAPAY